MGRVIMILTMVFLSASSFAGGLQVKDAQVACVNQDLNQDGSMVCAEIYMNATLTNGITDQQVTGDVGVLTNSQKQAVADAVCVSMKYKKAIAMTFTDAGVASEWIFDIDSTLAVVNLQQHNIDDPIKGLDFNDITCAP